MASLGSQELKSGILYHVRLSPGENINRAKIHFGNITKKEANTALSHIKALIKNR